FLTLCFLSVVRPPTSTLFPYTTLFRSLHDTVRDDVELLFADSIDTLAEHEHGVDVTFRGGGRRTFDVVVGADGLHSHTRALTFGPEEQFHRYLGYCFGIFTVPNTEGLSREVVMWNAPGRAAALYATRADEPLHAFLNVAVPEPPLALLRDPAAQHALLADRFAGDGWRVPGMVAAARESDDLFFDTVSQVRMPRWSSGRVVLTGDAAHAPSFLTGQGTSLALVGAYMLARSLATQPDHTAAFAAYERDTRGFVELNQAQVGRGDTALFPVTAEDLERRN